MSSCIHFRFEIMTSPFTEEHTVRKDCQFCQ
jgi:hypothetical protein